MIRNGQMMGVEGGQACFANQFYSLADWLRGRRTHENNSRKRLYQLM